MAIRAVLYDADGHDREMDLAAESIGPLTDRQLLWIDICPGDAGQVAAACERLNLPREAIALAMEEERPRGLRKFAGFLYAVVSALHHRDNDEWSPVRLHVLWDRQVVLTAHQKPVDAFSEFVALERGESEVGALSGDLFVAALLDWHLAAYFKATEQIERAIDHFDERVLTHEPEGTVLEDLVRMRRRISRLRFLLADQREVLYGLTRPAISHAVGRPSAAQFALVAARFDRARDLLEHAAELVHGSFDLHASRATDSVNAFLKVLTFATVLLGAMGVVAGILGMNFQAHLFETGEHGFWTVVAAEVGAAAVALIVARVRRWI